MKILFKANGENLSIPFTAETQVYTALKKYISEVVISDVITKNEPLSHAEGTFEDADTPVEYINELLREIKFKKVYANGKEFGEIVEILNEVLTKYIASPGEKQQELIDLIMIYRAQDVFKAWKNDAYMYVHALTEEELVEELFSRNDAIVEKYKERERFLNLETLGKALTSGPAPALYKGNYGFLKIV